MATSSTDGRKLPPSADHGAAVTAASPPSASASPPPSPSPPPSHAATLPARWPPLLYFGFAHACLAAAFAAAAVAPRSLGGFFYHPRMLAVAHLVTLGWISASILGSIYIVGPLAFRMPLPARRTDFVAFLAFTIGVLGMVSHFWMDSPSGMAWSAGLVTLTFAHVSLRALLGLRTAPVSREARLPVALAFLNVLGAALLGTLLAVNKVSPFLEVRHLDAVFAHAHLAGLGWGTLMVMGAGYRMLPMILPAAMPRGAFVYASAVMVELGVIGLVVSFLNGGRGLAASALAAAAGIGLFLSRVAWMLRNRRPAPTELRRPDWGTWHALQAMLYLVAALALGLYLALAPVSEAAPGIAMAYGVFGLVGFLSQIVVGVEARVLPLFGWLWGFADRGYADSPPSLHAVPVRALQALVFGLWTGGVPLLASGLAFDRPLLVSMGAGGLLVAVLASLANIVVVLARLWRVGVRG